MQFSQRTYILTLFCEDQPGIVAAITAELASAGANIAESNQFWDRQTNRFFMRIGFVAGGNLSREALERVLKPAIERFGIEMVLVDTARKPKIVIMVSKFDHAMRHLLYQIQVGWLHAEVAAIVSNHEDSRGIVEREGIPYHLWPVSGDNKTEQEAKVLVLVKETGTDLVVLARYMQVFSDDLCKRLYGKAINTPSLVPALVQRCEALPPGARARGQADRGDCPLRDRRSR